MIAPHQKSIILEFLAATQEGKVYYWPTETKQPKLPSKPRLLDKNGKLIKELDNV